MAKVDDKVMRLVERALKKNPQATSKELYKEAKGLSRSVSQLSVRQFHAKYALQVKRKLRPKKARRSAPRKPRPAAPKAAPLQVNREAIRKTLITFAKDISAAEGKSETIAVLGKLDNYIDEIIRAIK